MSFGISLQTSAPATALGGTDALTFVIERAREAEAAGVDDIWLNQGIDLDGITVAAGLRRYLDAGATDVREAPPPSPPTRSGSAPGVSSASSPAPPRAAPPRPAPECRLVMATTWSRWAACPPAGLPSSAQNRAPGGSVPLSQ
jgi:hypothetical protein